MRLALTSFTEGGGHYRSHTTRKESMLNACKRKGMEPDIHSFDLRQLFISFMHWLIALVPSLLTLTCDEPSKGCRLLRVAM